MKLKSVNRFLRVIIVSSCLVTINHAESDELSKLITKICIERFNSEMENSEQIEPKGMGAFTCKCFTSEVVNGSSIEKAQLTCKAKAVKKFSL